MPSVTDILATFPEFATPPASQSTYVTLATARTAEVGAWADENVYNLAVALRAAGMMADLGLVGSGTASGGQVTSEKIGSLAVGYAAPAAGVNPMTNGYWRQLAQLLDENIFAARLSFEP